jgi:hypothetical protein
MRINLQNFRERENTLLSIKFPLVTGFGHNVQNTVKNIAIFSHKFNGKVFIGNYFDIKRISK